MDTTTFDGLTRNLGSTLTRRFALRGLVASAAALVAGSAVLQADDAAAKRGGKKSKGKKGKKSDGSCRLIHCKPGFRCRKGKCRPHGKAATTSGLPEGSPCSHDGECQTSKHLICAVPVNAGNSDRTCCGAQGAGCGAKNEDGDETAPYCCVGHACVYAPGNGSWTCQAVA